MHAESVHHCIVVWWLTLFRGCSELSLLSSSEREVVARLLSAIGTRNRPPSREALPLHRSRSFSDGTQQLYSRPATREHRVL